MIGSEAANLYGQALLRDYTEALRKLYAGKQKSVANAEPPRLLPKAGEPQPSRDAYSQELARLRESNGADLTKPVSAYDAPALIALPETLQPPAAEPEASLADLYKEAYNAAKATAKRYPKPKIWGTFPPYDRSFSEANELAARWAHREDIEAGYQKAISYHGKWYLIEKFDSADLGYQIVGRLADEEYKDFAEEYRDYDKNKAGEGKPLSDGIGGAATLN